MAALNAKLLTLDILIIDINILILSHMATMWLSTLKMQMLTVKVALDCCYLQC